MRPAQVIPSRIDKEHTMMSHHQDHSADQAPTNTPTTPARDANTPGRTQRGATRSIGVVAVLAVVVVALAGLLYWRGSIAPSGAAHDGHSTSASQSSAFTPTGTPVTLGVGLPGIRLDDQHALVAASDDSSFSRVLLPATPTNRFVSATYFLSPAVGWAASSGDGGGGPCALTIYKTATGGNAWQTLSSLSIRACVNAAVTSFAFHDAQHGWAVVATVRGLTTNAGQVYTTSDGGATWTLLSSVTPSALWFTSATTGWMIAGRTPTSQDLFLGTTDGGHTWHNVALPVPQALSGAYATVSAPLWFTTDDGAIGVDYFQNVDQSPEDTMVMYRTSDGGRSWQVAQQFTIPASAAGSGGGLHMSASVGMRGYISGFDTTIYTSTNAGHSWSAATVSSLTALAIRDGAHFRDALHAWAFDRLKTCTGLKGSATCVTSDAILRTTDGGKTWTSTSISY